MSVLIVAATKDEVAGLDGHGLNQCITGIGVLETSYNLLKSIIENKPELVINIGIAGSFDGSLSIGDVVEVSDDQLGDLGADDNGNFKDLKDLGFIGSNKVYTASHSINHGLKKVSGITVNKVHGSELTIEKTVKKYSPQIETMEGAAVMMVCQNECIPCIQIRAISNYVEPRDKSKWDIPLSLRNLSKEVKVIIDTL